MQDLGHLDKTPSVIRYQVFRGFFAIFFWKYM